MAKTQRPATPEKRERRPAWAATALDSLRKNPSLSKAAHAAGVDRTTLWRLTQRDEEFTLAVNDAREEALDSLEEMIFERGRQGVPKTKTVTRTLADGSRETTVTEEWEHSDTAAIFYLKRWRPEFRDSYRIEQTGAGGGPIRVRIDSEKVDDAIRDLLADLAG